MGEIADMMLEGLLDEETGEYIGDTNKAFFGDESPGFPISYERNYRERGNPMDFGWEDSVKEKVSCPTCGKRVHPQGLNQHHQAKHGCHIDA